MKNILLILTLGIMFSAAQILDAQNPCPCDCDEIISSTNPTGSGKNTIAFLKTSFNPECYRTTLVLKACGNRTIRGFSFTIPTPNCFEGKNVNITMDNENLGVVDLGEEDVPTMFQLNEPILPCTSREVELEFCFPDNDGDCFLGEFGEGITYDIDVNYQFNPNEPPCDVQSVTMEKDVILDIEKSIEIDKLFDINGDNLSLKSECFNCLIQVFDVRGSIVLEVQESNVDISNLIRGAYQVIIIKDNTIQQTKFVKK